MSWSIEEHIGECRPFPAQVVVYKGETDECLAYVSGEVADRLKAENAKLREQIDAAHMSRLLTENENELLRELLVDVSEEVPWSFMDTTKYCMPLRADKLRKLLCRMRELGVEVNA